MENLNRKITISHQSSLHILFYEMFIIWSCTQNWTCCKQNFWNIWLVCGKGCCMTGFGSPSSARAFWHVLHMRVESEKHPITQNLRNGRAYILDHIDPTVRLMGLKMKTHRLLLTDLAISPVTHWQGERELIDLASADPVMATRADERSPAAVNVVEEEDDEHDSKERVLQRYFLQEWKLVKSHLDDIVSNGRVVDPTSVQKIRSIVCFLLS